MYAQELVPALGGRCFISGGEDEEMYPDRRMSGVVKRPLDDGGIPRRSKEKRPGDRSIDP
jgi:hypothetical protein